MVETSAVVPVQLSSARHHFSEVLGRQIFYREAGDPDAPAVILLHGAAASSYMFRNLIPYLGRTYHVIAPDYLGVGRFRQMGRRVTEAEARRSTPM